MRQSGDYMLYHLNGIPYLLPYGQGIADIRRGVRLNDTGAYLWELLSSEISEEEILSRCAAHFRASSGELPLLRTDVLHFLNRLRAYGILEEDPGFPGSATEGFSLNIGGLDLLLTGAAEPLSRCFSAFASERTASFAPDQIVEIRPSLPASKPLGRILLRSASLIVLENEKGTVLIFPSAASPLEALLSPDGSRVILSAAGSLTEPFLKDVFHAIRLCFLYLAQRRGLFALHSASLLYRDRLWLFSGHSGAGKSTHTGLWKKLLQTPLVNGDLNLLGWNDPAKAENAPSICTPVVHGLPWCGTSGISAPGSWPLGGIFFLRQAAGDRVEQLSPEEQQLLISQHLISPNWTREQAVLNLEAAGKFVSRIPICRLCCTKEPAAVATVRAVMDQWLDRTTPPCQSDILL